MKTRRPSIDSLVAAQGLAATRDEHVKRLVAQMAAQRACIAEFLLLMASRQADPNVALAFMRKDVLNILSRVRKLDGNEFNDDPELVRWSREEVDLIFDGITF